MPKTTGPLTLVGRRIRARRKQLKMNRAAFALAANVSESSVTRLERGNDVRASTYLAVIGYLQDRQSMDGIAERIALLPEPARDRVLALVHRFENPS